MRLPRGAITQLAGDPKLGKSFVSIAIAAAISRGSSRPHDSNAYEPGSVIIMSAEDDPARTIVKRLRAAGADMDKVQILESVILPDGNEALPQLRKDIKRIEDAVVRIGDCRHINIDPISAYLEGVDDHKNASLRGVLSPLKKLVEKHDLSASIVNHLNKGGGTNGKYRVSGSIAYVGACRANFLFVRDREDPTGKRILMLDNGCNLTDEVPTLAYRIGPSESGGGPVVQWEANTVPITAEQALQAEQEDNRDQADKSERKEAGDWLAEMLSEGPVKAKEVEAAAKANLISVATLRRAKQDLGVKSQRDGFGPDSTCYWRLP
jgi:hypothetical protein